ncbi:MAG: hypothetical protein HRT91_02950 [Piscirickettsiaceae bacterium]|nr:hypothetical protein [Piscirickettsiaceae bacterium]
MPCIIRQGSTTSSFGSAFYKLQVVLKIQYDRYYKDGVESYLSTFMIDQLCVPSTPFVGHNKGKHEQID